MIPTQKRSYVLFVRFPLLLSIMVLLVMGTFSRRGFLDFRRMRHQNSDLMEKMAKVGDQRTLLEKQIRMFETEKVEQERIVRQVLGYIKTNETVIEFE